VGQNVGDRMNVRLPHLGKFGWTVLILVLMLVAYLLLAGVIGGHASGGGS
jgi:hypothetical protein